MTFFEAQTPAATNTAFGGIRAASRFRTEPAVISRHPLINASVFGSELREALERALGTTRTAVENPGSERERASAAYSLLVALSASLNSPVCVPSLPVNLEGRSVNEDRIDLHIGLDGAASDRVVPLPMSLLLHTFASCEDFAAAQSRFIALLIPWLPKSAEKPQRVREPSSDDRTYAYRFRPAVAASKEVAAALPRPLEAKFWSRRGIPRYYLKDWHEIVGVTVEEIDSRRKIAQFDGRKLTAKQFAALCNAVVFVDEFGVVHVEHYTADDVLPSYEAAQRVNIALAERGLVVTSSASVPADMTFEQLVREALD